MSVFSTKAPPGVRGRGSSSPRRTIRDRAPIHPMAALNHQVGNSTLQRWMAASGIQAKLHVTEPNDRHEKEADNVANKVMRSPTDTKPVDEPISRVGGGAPAQRLTGNPLLHHPEPLDQTHEGSPIIQREPEGPVQSKSGDEPIQKADEIVQPKAEEPVQKMPDEPVQKSDEPVQSKSEEPVQKAEEPVQSSAEEPVQKSDESVQASSHDEPVQKADESVQSKHDEPVQKADESVQPKHEEPVQKANEPVQAKSNEEPIQKEDESVQSKTGAARAPAIPVGFATGLSASRGEGRPLPSESRSFFEKRIGADLSSVRIHADQRGADLSRSVHAKAFTRANHIYFAQGQYNPYTSSGQLLLAHELTHVVQQGHATVQRQSSATPVQRAPEEEGRAVSDEQRAQALAAAARAAKIAGQAKAFGQRETAKSKQEKETKVASEQAHKQKAAQHRPSKKALAGGKHKPAGKRGGLIVLPPTQTAAKGKAPHSPYEDPAFHKMVNRAAGAAKKQKHHVPATAKAGAAQAAAVMPPEQTMGTAQGNQAAAMQNAPTPGFNAASFKAQLMSRIQELTPKTTEQADEFKNNNQLGAVKQDMSGKVSEERRKASGPLEEKKDEAPDTKSVPPKPVTPLAGLDAPAPVGQLGAKDAAPKPKTTAEVEAPIQENTKRIGDEMAKEKITDEQLAKSNEPKFQQALGAKQTAEKQAKTGPVETRKAEQAQIGKAEAQATAMAANRVGAMQGARAQNSAAVLSHQSQTKTKDETARREVGQRIQGIYDKTKAEVDRILGALDGKVEKAFDEGSAAARKAFEDLVAARMDAYKEDRYGGWFGWARWAKDKIAGMPSEVNEFYAEGRKLYLAKMDAVIDNVVAIIGSELAAAKAEIAKGRKEIADYLNTLSPDLRKVGAEAAENIQSQFDSLEESVNSKANELIDTLANKYIENLKAVDDRIEELKAANQGLVDAAIGAIKGVIEAIISLKNLFMRVLAKIIDVVTLIIADPIGFLKNLIDAIKLGLANFASNILTHLKNAFIIWLTGALGPMNIKMPDDIFSLPGVFSLAMQILGLSWEYLRERAVKHLGEPVVKALEIGFDLFKIFIKDGVAGLWEYAKEKFNDLKEMIIEKIKEMLITQVIKAGIKWLLGLLNPVAAFIKAAMAIYDIVVFFMEKAKQVLELIEAFVDGVAAVAKGSIGGAAKLVEDALAKALPIVIGFLANLLGIGGLAEKAQKLFTSLRERRDKFVDGIILKAKKWAGKFIGKATGATKSILKLAFTKHRGFHAGGESHETWISEDGEPQVASRAVSLATRTREWQRRVPALPDADRGKATALLTTCTTLNQTLKSAAKAALRARGAQDEKAVDNAQQTIDQTQTNLKPVLAQLFTLFGDTKTAKGSEDEARLFALMETYDNVVVPLKRKKLVVGSPATVSTRFRSQWKGKQFPQARGWAFQMERILEAARNVGTSRVPYLTGVEVPIKGTVIDYTVRDRDIENNQQVDVSTEVKNWGALRERTKKSGEVIDIPAQIASRIATLTTQVRSAIIDLKYTIVSVEIRGTKNMQPEFRSALANALLGFRNLARSKNKKFVYRGL